MQGQQTYLGWTLGTLLLWVIIIPIMAEQVLPAAPLPLFEGGSLNLQNVTEKVVVNRFLASW